MRIVMYDDMQIGVVADDESVVGIGDLLDQFDPPGPEFLLPDLLTNWSDLEADIASRVASGNGTPVADVELHAPLVRPSKIVCLIGNFREGTDRPLQILDIFFKSPDGISGPNDTVLLPPHDASIFHHEAELAIIIGQETSNVSRDKAMDAIFGYTVYNDVSARGLGREGSASFLGKSFDTFAAFGPWIMTADEIEDPYNLHITVEVDGELRQDYNTSDIERPLDELISYISSVTPLHPGDVICCGTNHQGLGAMQNGDTVVTGIDAIGSFALHVRDSAAREWQRGVDEEMAARVRAMAEQPAAPSQGGNA